MSSNPYSFTGNQDQSPNFVPYHMAAPTLTSPSSGNTFDNEVDIQWSSANDSLSHSLTYTIYYSTTNGASWQEITSGLTTTNYLWDVSAFTNETVIQVKVHAIDNIGFEASSNINTFDIFRRGEPPSQTPTTTTTDQVTTTPGLEIIIILFSLAGLQYYRRKMKKN